MNPRYRLSPEADADLDEAYLFVAQVSVEAASRLLDNIYDALLRLAEMPRMGHMREDLTDQPVRFWNVQSYLIIYRPDTDPLEIVRVVNGYRDVSALLNP